MPIPSRREDEKPNDFMSRCMTDNKLKEEFYLSYQQYNTQGLIRTKAL